MSCEKPKNFPVLEWNAAITRLHDKAKLYFENTVQRGNGTSYDNDMTGHVCDKCEHLPGFTSFKRINEDIDECKDLFLVISKIPGEYLMKLLEKTLNSLRSLELSYYITPSFEIDLIILKCLIWFIQRKMVDPPLLPAIEDLLEHFDENLYNRINCDSDFYLKTIKVPILALIGFLVRVGLVTPVMLDIVGGSLTWRKYFKIVDIEKFLYYFKGCLKLMDDLHSYASNLLSENVNWYASCMLHIVNLMLYGADYLNILNNEDIQQKMQNCAEIVNRLLLDLAKYETRIKTCFPFSIVRKYYRFNYLQPIDELIKIRLKPGINKMLHLCTKEQVEEIANEITENITLTCPSTL